MSIINIPVNLKNGTPADQESRLHETSKWISIFPGSLAVHDRASECAKAKWYLSFGTQVEIDGIEDEFFKVNYGKNLDGYVNSRFIRRC